MLKIRAMKDGFRRAGEAFSKAPRTYPDDYFTYEQMEQIMAEPMLAVELLPEPEPILELETVEKEHPGTGEEMTAVEAVGSGVLDVGKDLEEAEARKALENMKNDKLKKECDAMGIAYPADATKAVLVDLLLKKTAPAPEA